jgi:sporulation protein YlmC with PRC-barrel domain
MEHMMAIEEKEQGNLIGSDKVEGTAVYGSDSAKIGSIERVMIDKMTGKVSYAVLSFGGFLGMGDEHYPLPWHSLKYNTQLGGYVINLTEAQLKGAPSYDTDDEWNWSDPGRTRTVDDYYGF